MKAPNMYFVGEYVSALNWSRMRIHITKAVITDSNGIQQTLTADGHLVDASDEMSPVKCSLEHPDFSNGNKPEPTMRIAAGKEVVIFLGESLILN